MPLSSCSKSLIGRGHAPQHAFLWNQKHAALIAGDQILPEITPNIGVLPWFMKNPLRDYLHSLRQFAELPCRLLLPAHGPPIQSYAARIVELQRHHDVQLGTLTEFCTQPRSVYDCTQALFKRDLPTLQLSFALGEAAALPYKTWMHCGLNTPLAGEQVLDQCAPDATTRSFMAVWEFPDRAALEMRSYESRICDLTFAQAANNFRYLEAYADVKADPARGTTINVL